MARRPALLLAAAVAALAAFVGPASAAAGPAVDARALRGHGELTFLSGGSLYVLDGATGALRRVTRGAPAPADPAFSADGRWLAFVRAEDRAHGGAGAVLWLARGDGAGARPVAGLPPVLAVPDSGAPAYSWSPTADELAVTTVARRGLPVAPDAVWVVRAGGGAHRVFGPGVVDGFAWAPDAPQLALAVGAGPGGGEAVETVGAGGGRPQRWLAERGSTLSLAGWPAGAGLLVLDDRGNGGPSVENDGLPLDLLADPGGPLVPLATVPLLQPPAVDVGPSGAVALVALSVPNGTAPGADVTDALKFVWFGRTVETCALWAPVASPAPCTAVGGARGTVTLDPARSGADGRLAFVEAPARTTGLPPASQPLVPWPAVSAWEAAHTLWVVPAGATAPVEVAGGDGASDPVWSDRTSTLLFVKDRSLWLLPRVGTGARPVEVAGPLDLPAHRGGFLFGYVDWPGEFAWSDPGGASP